MTTTYYYIIDEQEKEEKPVGEYLYSTNDKAVSEALKLDIRSGGYRFRVKRIEVLFSV